MNHTDYATGDGMNYHSWASIVSQGFSIAGTDALPLKVVSLKNVMYFNNVSVIQQRERGFGVLGFWGLGVRG